jgi:hypothetical protein
MADVSYVPGNRTAIVGDCCWLLIDAAPDSAAVSEIWPYMEQAPQLDALVASLLRFGFDHVPDFVLLVAAEGRHQLICRGRASASLIADDSPKRVDGTGLATWLEYPVAAAVERVVLGEPPAGTDLQLPASAGVFLAHSVTIDLTATSRNRDPGASPPVVAAPAPQPGVPQLAARADATSAPMAARAAGSGRHAASTFAYPGADPGVRGYAAPVASNGAGREGVDAGPAEDTPYDFLFGATQARTVEDAAVRPATEDEDEPPLPLPVSVAQELPPLPLTNAAVGTGPDDPVAPAGLIDAVPWASDVDPMRSASTRAVPRSRLIAPAPAAASDADDGSTVMRSDLLKLAARPMASDRIGPMVHALLCPSSHVNPPGNSACRVCGAALPQQDPVTVPRPVLGVLRLSTGDAITLDRGVVVGRSPRTDFSGEERPHIVKLPSGDGEISRTHLQVILDGWRVLVTDLHSTNGTLIVLPGRDPEQLRPGEPVPIQPGTVVILAIGIQFRYEVAE